MSEIQEVTNDEIVVRNSFREAIIILLLWLVSMIYTGIYCYCYGYVNHDTSSGATGAPLGGIFGTMENFDRDPASITFPFDLGIPGWVFWGIVVPWGVCIFLTFVFCFFIFSEDELGEEKSMLENSSNVETLKEAENAG